MSVLTRFGAGLGLGAMLLGVVGCFDDEVSAIGDQGRYDRRALDMYMTDVARPDVSRPAVAVEVSKPGAYTSFFGDWEAKIDMKEQMEKERAKRQAEDPNYDPQADAMGDAFAQGMAEMMSFALSIKEDKSFVMTMMFIPIEGHWQQKGDQIWLHPDKVMGMTKEEMQKMAGPNGKVEMKNEEPLILKISPDGETLTAIDPKGVSGTDELVFKRKAA